MISGRAGGISSWASGGVRQGTRAVLLLAVCVVAGLSLQAWLLQEHEWNWLRSAAGLDKELGLAALAIFVVPLLGLGSRPKQAVRQVLLVLAGSGILFALAGHRRDLAAAGVLNVLVILAGRALWPQLSESSASRQGQELLALAAALAVTTFLLHPLGSLKVAATLALLSALVAAIWGLKLLGENPPLPLERGSGPARDVYAAHAQSSVSPFALMRDKGQFWSPDQTTFLAYGCRAGVALILGPGIGREESLPVLYSQFRNASRRGGWRVALYQVSASTADQFGAGRRRGIGSEAVVDLKTLGLEGSSMARLRHEVARARRQGVSTSIQDLSDVGPGVRAEMDELAAGWRRGHAEMRFSVGSPDDRPAVRTSVGIARDHTGTLIAYTTWLWLPAASGVVLDEMRRSSAAPGGAVDFLIYECLRAFRSRADWASLGLAPLGGGGGGTGWLLRLEDRALNMLGLNASTSLFAFKAKFQPRWEPRFLVVEHLADWPRVALAMLLLHFPRLTGGWRRLFAYRQIPVRLLAGVRPPGRRRLG